MSDIREAINYDLAELIVVSPPYRYRIQRPRLPDGRIGPDWTTPGDEVDEVLDIMLDGRNIGPRPTDDRERIMLWDQTYAAAQHELLNVLHDENVLTYRRERLP